MALRPQIISAVILSVAFAGAVCLDAGASSCLAQGANPSADQIIKSLTPKGDINKTIKLGARGLRPSAPLKDEQTAQIQRTYSISKVNASTGVVPGKQTEDLPAEEAPSIDLTVNFATGSADLTAQATQTLDALGTALSSSALASYRFRVEGHTDTVGTRDFNRTLSQQRAETVAHYVGTKFGVAASRLEPVGMGSEGLLVPTSEQVAEPRNRRVEIINLGS